MIAPWIYGAIGLCAAALGAPLAAQDLDTKAWRMFEEHCLEKPDGSMMSALSDDRPSATDPDSFEVATATADGKMLMSGDSYDLEDGGDVIFVNRTSGTTFLPEGYFSFCSLHFSTIDTEHRIDLESAVEANAWLWLGDDLVRVGGRVRSLPLTDENTLEDDEYRSFFATPGFPPKAGIWVQQGQYGTGIGINRSIAWGDQ